jgi:hypothetical protein
MPEEIDPEDIGRKLDRFKEKEVPRPVPRAAPGVPSGRPMPKTDLTLLKSAVHILRINGIKGNDEELEKILRDQGLVRSDGLVSEKAVNAYLDRTEDLSGLFGRWPPPSVLPFPPPVDASPWSLGEELNRRARKERDVLRGENTYLKEKLKKEKQRNFPRSRYVILSAIASLFIGYGIRSCREETPIPEPNPAAATVPQEKYDSLQKRLEETASQLSDRDRESVKLRQNSEAAAEIARLEEELRKSKQREEDLESKLSKITAKIAENPSVKLSDLMKQYEDEIAQERAERAQVYFEFGDKLFDLGFEDKDNKEKIQFYKEAKEKFEQAIALREKAHDHHLLGLTFVNLGNLQKGEKRVESWESAVPHLQKTVDMRNSPYDNYLLGSTLSELKETKKGEERLRVCRKIISHLDEALARYKKDKKDSVGDWTPKARLHLGSTLICLGDLLRDPNEMIQTYQRAIGPLKAIENYDLLASVLNRVIGGTELKFKDRKEKLGIFQNVLPHTKELISARASDDDYKLFDRNVVAIIRELGDCDKINSTLSDLVKFAEKFKGTKRIRIHESLITQIQGWLVRSRNHQDDYSLLKRNIAGVIGELGVDYIAINRRLENYFRFAQSLKHRQATIYDSTLESFLSNLIRSGRNEIHYKLAERILSSVVQERIRLQEYSEAFDDLSMVMKASTFKLDKIRAYKLVMPLVKKMLEARGSAEDFRAVENSFVSVLVKEGLDSEDYKLVQETLLDFAELSKSLDYTKRRRVFQAAIFEPFESSLDQNVEQLSPTVKDLDGYYYWLGKVFYFLADKEDDEERKTELYVRALIVSERADSTVRHPKRKLTKEEKKDLKKDLNMYERHIKDIRGKLKLRSKDWHKKADIIAKKAGKIRPNLSTENFVVKLGRDKAGEDLDLAIRCYRFSIDNFDWTRRERYELGMLYKKQGELTEAIKYLGRAAWPCKNAVPAKMNACVELARMYWQGVELYENNPAALTKEKWNEYRKNLERARKYYNRALGCPISSSLKKECTEGAEKTGKLSKLKLKATRKHFENN